MEPSIIENTIYRLGSLYPDVGERLSVFLRTQRQENRHPKFDYYLLQNDKVLCRSRRNHQWIHGPSDPLEQAEAWIRSSGEEARNLLVVWYAGLGYVARLLEQYSHIHKIILCESRLELIWEWMNRWDARSTIDNQRFLWVIDENPANSLRRLARDYPCLFHSGFTLIPGSVLSKEECEQMRDLQAELSNIPVQSSPDNPKTFAIISTAMAEIMPAVLRGIGQNEYLPLWKPQPPAVSYFLQGVNTWRDTLGCVPKAALGFYGSFLSADELIDMGNAGVERAIWYYDQPEKILTGKESQWYDLAFTFDRYHLNVLRPVFGVKAKVLSAATSFDGYHPSGAFPYPIQPVTYVGSSGYRLSLPLLQQNPQLAPHLIQRVRSIVREWLGKDPVRLLDELCENGKAFDPQSSPTFSWLLRQLAASEIRMSFLTAAMPYGLSIFGDALWNKTHFAGSLVPCFAGTSLRYESETPELYAASKINLSICHAQVIEGNPIRIYDVLACGGFLLAEYRPSLEAEFTIGRDLDVFRTPEELARKIEFYLENDELRREIAECGRQTVLTHHTYRHRIAAMVNFLHISH